MLGKSFRIFSFLESHIAFSCSPLYLFSRIQVKITISKLNIDATVLMLFQKFQRLSNIFRICFVAISVELEMSKTSNLLFSGTFTKAVTRKTPNKYISVAVIKNINEF